MKHESWIGSKIRGWKCNENYNIYTVSKCINYNKSINFKWKNSNLIVRYLADTHINQVLKLLLVMGQVDSMF